MNRRETIALLGGAAAAWPLSVSAQQVAMPRIGVLHSASPTQFTDAAFLQGLREAGFVEGRNVLIEFRWAKGAYERLPALVEDLIGLRVDLIAVFGTPAVRIAKAASAKVTPAIPVVFAMGSDPVREGLVESLNRPGGHLTGVTSIAGALGSKRVELMREFQRDNTALGLLINPGNPISEMERREVEAGSTAIGQPLEILTASNAAEIDMAFTALKTRRVGALIIAVDTFFFTQMQRMATLAAQHAVPAMGPLREFAVEGGLLSYGTSISEINRQTGLLAGKVLKGARPADLPVQQPTKFELVVNLKTAKTLGADVSSKLLALADEVIE
jgi:putative ABC transport system substrate-binding protein